jgi:hypothetical protein
VSDWYIQIAGEQYNQLKAQRAQELANLESARSNYDNGSAALYVQALADVDQKINNLASLVQQYQHSQQPAPQQYVERESGPGELPSPTGFAG